MNTIFLAKAKSRLLQAYHQEQIGESPLLSEEDFRKNPLNFQNVNYIFSTWDMIPFSEEELERYLPNLIAVFYAAGSVKKFARPFLKKGIRIFSAWKANAVPVSEFLLGQILLANKGYFLMPQRYQQEGYQASRDYCRSFTGNYNAKIGFIGYGSITEYTISLLKPFSVEIYVASQHLTDEDYEKMSIQKASIEEVFSQCQTISNNMSNLPHTEKILTEHHFRSMQNYSTFINTGRGAQVDLEGLKRAFQDKPNCVALLDVTDPAEPLPPDDNIWNIPNIFITPHSAGSTAQEIFRMGDMMIDTHKTLEEGNTPHHEVHESMLDSMA